MPECSTLTIHISRHILDDGGALIRIGSSMFRMYQNSGFAQLHICGREYQTLTAKDAAFNLVGMAEALAERWNT